MGSETESHSVIDGRANSPTIHAVQSVTVVLTVAVDDARLARSVAIRWHRTREGMQKMGTPPADGAEDVTTITYNFVADRPGTFTYHANYRRDRATCLVNVRACEAGPSAAGRARVPGRRARTAAGHGVVNVALSDQRPIAGSRAGTTVRRAIGCARRARGMASVEAQLMYNCPVIYYDAAEYDGGPPVQRLLRRSVATLAAAVVNVRACEAGPSTGRPASTTVRRAADTPASRGTVNVESQLNDAAEAEYDGGPPVQRFLRWSVSTLAAAVLWVCGARDPDELRRGSELSTTLS